MKKIDEAQLETDPQARFVYLAEFIGFTAQDMNQIQSCAPYFGPQIGEIVEKTYEKLLQYDATARHFLPRQSGYEGPLPIKLEDLIATHPQIQFRREHLSRYFMQLLGRSFDPKIALYLDMVGKIHTLKAGSPELNVPLVQMNALMGLMSDILIAMIEEFPIDDKEKMKTIRAFNKLLWIQNDFISRHYSEAA